jgi:hypothetical protein
MAMEPAMYSVQFSVEHPDRLLNAVIHKLRTLAGS